MESISSWIICLIAASLIGNVYGQCTICAKNAEEAACTTAYHNPYPINVQMCQSIANNKNIETSACNTYKDGYRIICKTKNQDATAEVLAQDCKIECPPPKIIHERFHGNSAPKTVAVTKGKVILSMLVIATWTKFIF